MNITVVEFICDENMAAPGTPPTPRPADRPRPSAEDVKASRSSVQSFGGPAEEATPAQPSVKQDINA